MHFRQQLFRPPISDFDSQITVICNGSVSRPHFRSQQFGTLCCISHHLQLVDCSANCVSVTSSFRSLCFEIPDLIVFHLNSSFINKNNIFWTSIEVTKTKQKSKQGSEKHPSDLRIGALVLYLVCPLCRKASWQQNTIRIRLFILQSLQRRLPLQRGKQAPPTGWLLPLVI